MNQRKLLLLCMGISLSVFADDKTNEQSTQAKGNQELPKILYVVPWKEIESKKISNPKLVLHNLVDDLYEPQIASDWNTH